MKVLLYQPDDGRKPTPPLQLMVLAGVLKRAGHDPVIVDARMKARTGWSRVRDSVPRDYDMVGISVLTGNQITDAVSFASGVKEGVPKVWGGWHPTLMPEQTVRHPLVDYVVEGQGHDVIVRLANGDDPQGIPGVWWKGGHNEPAQYTPFASLPRPDWMSVDLQRYMDAQPELIYMASDGCAYRCGYCSISFLKHQWSGIDPEVVGEELHFLSRTYRFDNVYFCDPLWFLNLTWTECVLDVISGLDLKWFTSTRSDLACRIPDEMLEKARRVGMYCLALGIESGSDDVLKRVNKHESVGQNREAVNRLVRAGLELDCHFMFATPGETSKDVSLTLKFIRSIMLHRGITMIPLYYYTPYPGTALYTEWLKENKEPSSLEEWAGIGWTIPQQAKPDTVRQVERLRFFLKRGWKGRLAYYFLSRLWLR